MNERKTSPGVGGVDRRAFGLGLAAGAAALTLPGDLWAQGKPDSIVVAIQGGNMAKLTAKITDAIFEKRTGVKVKHLIGAHKDRIVKLRAEVPKASFHAYYSNANYIAQATAMDLLEPISTADVPGFEMVPKGLRTGHAIMTMYTAEGLLYNPKVMAKPTSWSVLWDPKYKGKIGVNRYIDRMMMICSAYKTGGKKLDDEAAAWQALGQLVNEQKGKVFTSSEQLGQMFEQGEVAVAPFWQARSVQWMKAGHPVAFSAPSEGAISESWGFGIPKGTPKELKALAGKWIGIHLEKDASVQFAKGWGYPSTNPAVDYPPDIAGALLTREEFANLKNPDYAWLVKNTASWTERFNKLLSR